MCNRLQVHIVEAQHDLMADVDGLNFVELLKSVERLLGEQLGSATNSTREYHDLQAIFEGSPSRVGPLCRLKQTVLSLVQRKSLPSRSQGSFCERPVLSSKPQRSFKQFLACYWVI